MFHAVFQAEKMFIALTGGIGCGKSLVLAEFAKLGFQTSDADRICHEFYRTNEGLQALTARWGGTILNDAGELDRKKLGNIVFRDPAELAFLEDLIRPWLKKRLEELRREARSAEIMVEVPLLFEKDLAKEFDRTIAVWSDFAVRRKRLAARGWDHAECSRRERLQWDPARKLASADFGLINQGSLTLLAAQCRCLAERLRARKDSIA